MEHLPPDSAVARTTTGGWDDEKELLASAVELLHAVYRATLASGGAKRGQVPKQMRIPRPEAEKAQPRQASEDEVLAFFAAMTAQGGEHGQGR